MCSDGTSSDPLIERPSTSLGNLRVAVWSVVALGFALMSINLDLPVVRNGFCYAKAALGINQHHFNVFEISHDITWTCGKPVLFAVLAAPLVAVFDGNVGTMIASAIGTSFFVWSASLALRRINLANGLSPSLLVPELILTSVNPLVMSQFGSGYPDALFSGFVLLAFFLIDVIATEPARDTRWQILALGVTSCLAILTKLYGAVLLIVCPLYFLAHHRIWRRNTTGTGRKFILGALVFASLVFMLWSARLGLNPLLPVTNGGGLSGYADGSLDVRVRAAMLSLALLGVALLLNFHVSLACFCKSPPWRTLGSMPQLFALIYLLGLLPFDGTPGNMRYLLPLFPFLAASIISGAASWNFEFRRRLTFGFWASAAIMVLLLNIEWFQEVMPSRLAATVARWENPGSFLDNFRLVSRNTLRQQMDVINAIVPAGGTYYWASGYYWTATQGLVEHLGLRAGLDVRYVTEPSEIPPSKKAVFMTHYVLEPETALLDAPSWASPVSVGHGVFRLDPLSVEFKTRVGDPVTERGVVRLEVNTIVGDGISVSEVEFWEEGTLLGRVRKPPYVLQLSSIAPGRHEFFARVHYGDRDIARSEPAVVYVGRSALERSAQRAKDISVEENDRSISRAYGTLRLVPEHGIVGLRFDDIPLGSETKITRAYLEFEAAELTSAPASFQIEADASAQAPALTLQDGDLSHRARGGPTVKWEPGPWRTSGYERTSDLTALLNEIIRQPDWASGNTMVVLIRGSGRRVIRGADFTGQGAPRLHIEFD